MRQRRMLQYLPREATNGAESTACREDRGAEGGDDHLNEAYVFPACFCTISCRRCRSFNSICRNSMPNSWAFAHLIAA